MTGRVSKAVEAEARRRLNAAKGDVHAAFLRAIRDGFTLQRDVDRWSAEASRLTDELEDLRAKRRQSGTRKRAHDWASANFRQHKSLAEMSRVLASVLARRERTILAYLYEWNDENNRPFPRFRWK
ncbi:MULTISPECIES: hypothetical protein [unclassified Variovorax]|uniref:hypothetical protein n=1 Tax=unclassified Variovorax TaxID=663243 RepID=UPI0011AF76C6|nr:MULTISPECIES: hypothetical protein [unclassified Variovorax]